MKIRIAYLFLLALALTKVGAQEDSPFITYDVPSQNLLKFNRFLINPTFSTVREDKSYVNLLHRNQSVQFDDNNQAYFLSYSGRIDDRTGLGLSLYAQREGLISNYGVLANYAYGIKLSEKSNFTFGANFSYYNSGFDQNRANPTEEDPLLSGFQDNSLLTFQPGFNISYGQFDFGLFAENLFDYNLKTSESVTVFTDKTFSGHLQYTHQLSNGSGLFEDGRLMPLARIRKVGEDDFVLGGNLIMDLPKLGWLQGGYDSFYGAAAGIGFNLNRRISIGYTMEKGLSSNFDNFGLTHEISFAYSFTPTLTEDRVMLEDSVDTLADATPEESPGQEVFGSQDEEIEALKKRLAENDAVLAELLFRQDSIEANRERDLERRFEMVMRMVRKETGGSRPDLEERAKDMYFNSAEPAVLASSPDETSLQDHLKADQSTERYQPLGPPETNGRPEEVTDRVTTGGAAAVNAERPVKSRKFSDLQGVREGYYVVANVYRGTSYLNSFIDRLKEDGIEAAYFDNSRNGLKYVYLERYDTWAQALEAYQSGFDGRYEGALWILNVDNEYSNEAYVENSRKIREKSEDYENGVLQKNVVVRDNVPPASANEEQPSGLGTNYYIIANVFANPRNANRFVKLLNAQGLSASYFTNPENNYRYVYLKRHESWNSALISYYSKLNDAYKDNMWIMRVTPNQIT